MRTVFAGMLLCLTSLATPAVRQEFVIVREGTKLYHRPGCPLIREAKNVLAMTRAEADGRGIKAHPECDPAVAGAEGRPAVTNPVVFVDPGKYYHRETCRLLEKPSRRLKLDEAARKYFPCRTCKPPIRQRR